MRSLLFQNIDWAIQLFPTMVIACVLTVIYQPILAEDAKPSQTAEHRDHQDLSYFVDQDGKKQPIKTRNDWAKRREHILAQMQTVMGPLPNPKEPVPLDSKILEEKHLADMLRVKLSYCTDSTKRRVSAYLFIPTMGKYPKAAILCLHQTTGVGKEEPAGISGKPSLHYALHLAKRGYVTLAPDYPSFGEYPYEFPASDGYNSGTMKAIYDNMRGIDLLASLPQVDAEKIGCIGHSLGGHNTMFTAAFDRRIKVLVSNCGFTRFHKYYKGNLQGWTSDRYMPRIRTEHNNDPNQVPFDFPEIVASFSPRPFLASSPLHDSNFEVSGVKETIQAARPIYSLFGVADNLQANYPDCAHDFPPDVREVAYQFFEKHLPTTK